MRISSPKVVITSALLMAALFTVGCGKDTKTAEADKANVADQAESAKTDHQHGEWWCAEHGIPEETCGQCNAKFAAECQKKGDWCEMHDRPDSQCFVCHPEFKAKFAAQYKAKYGKEPPPIEDE